MSKVGCLSKVTSLTRKLSGGGVTQNTKLYTDALITRMTRGADLWSVFIQLDLQKYF